MNAASKALTDIKIKPPDFKAGIREITKEIGVLSKLAAKGPGTWIADTVAMKRKAWAAMNIRGKDEQAPDFNLKFGPGVEQMLNKIGAKAGRMQTPAALQKGTVAAYSAITQAQYKTQDRSAQITATESKKTNSKLDKITNVLVETMTIHSQRGVVKIAH